MTDPETPGTDAPDVELDHYYVTHEMMNGEVQAVWFGHLARSDKRLFICEIQNNEARATRIAAALNSVEGISTEELKGIQPGALGKLRNHAIETSIEATAERMRKELE